MESPAVAESLFPSFDPIIRLKLPRVPYLTNGIVSSSATEWYDSFRDAQQPGMDVIHDKRVDKLHTGIVGNPATHMPAMVAGLPGMEGLATKMMKKKIDELDIPTVREMIEILDDAGAEIYGCQMAAEMMDIDKKDLLPQVKDIITAMDFFDKSEGAQTIFI